MAEHSLCVVTYDVVSDRQRLKIARFLEAVGNRVQESVFEAYLTVPDLEKLLKKVGKVLNAEEDSLRVCFLCSECREKLRTTGRAHVTPVPGVKIV